MTARLLPIPLILAMGLMACASPAKAPDIPKSFCEYALQSERVKWAQMGFTVREMKNPRPFLEALLKKVGSGESPEFSRIFILSNEKAKNVGVVLVHGECVTGFVAIPVVLFNELMGQPA